MARNRTVAGAGIIATAALVILFGNQAVTDWVANRTSANSAWGWYLRVLTWPRWAFAPDGNSNAAMRKLLADDLRALLLILFVALVLGMVAKGIGGGAIGFFIGWSALVFASALAAFLTAFIIFNPTFIGALEQAADGSTYGLFVGWIVGIVTGSAKSAGP